MVNQVSRYLSAVSTSLPHTIMADPTSALQVERIIGDVLAPETKVPYNLKVRWPNATLERPGQMIDRDATQPKPAVFIDPPVCRTHRLSSSRQPLMSQQLENISPSETFILLMVDPVGMARGSPAPGKVLTRFNIRTSPVATTLVSVKSDIGWSPKLPSTRTVKS